MNSESAANRAELRQPGSTRKVRYAVMGLLLSVMIAFLPALAGMVSAPGAWYAALAKPSFTPPGSVFGPVWSLLYLTLGIASWLVWRVRGAQPRRNRALALYAGHLVLNAAWSPVFFLAQMPGAAFALICVIWLTAVWMLMLFASLRAAAGTLLIPYLLWISFALVLNGVIWLMNS